MKKMLIKNLRKELRGSTNRNAMSVEKKRSSQTCSGSLQSDKKGQNGNRALPAWNGK